MTAEISFEPVQNQTEPSWNPKQGWNPGFDQYFALSDMFGVKNHVLKLENSMVTSKNNLNNSKTKTNQARTKNIAETMVLNKFGPVVTCWV